MDALQSPGRPHGVDSAPFYLPSPSYASVHQVSAARRGLGVVAFFVLTALSLPVHAFALFFVYVEFLSPGDRTTSTLLVAGSFFASFMALLVTGTLSQLIGSFPGRWRARVSFAAFSAVIALAVTAVAALTVL